MIPSGVIFIWPSTAASIPSGWERETDLDTKYLKGTANGVDPGDTGGSNTHSHTSPSHTHTMIGHTHSGDTSRDGAQEDHSGSSHDVARDSHIHSYTTSTTTGGSLEGSATYVSTNHEPPYYEVIFIKPSDAAVIFSDAIIALWNTATAPNGFTFCDGSGTTPDLRELYLKGAAVAGDGGGTGGSTTHTHTVDHGHSAVTHTHSGTTGQDSNQTERYRNIPAGGGAVCPHHTHTITLDANSAESVNSYSGSCPAEETEPSYKKLVPIKNTSGGDNQVRGMIGLWLGALADIPRGWLLCDGSNGTPDMRGYFLKCANTESEFGDTGGSNTHSHSASNSHTHTATGTHTHPSGSTDTNVQTGSTGTSSDYASKTHSHTMDTCDSKTSTWNTATISANSSNSEPAYMTVAFIQFGFAESAMNQIF